MDEHSFPLIADQGLLVGPGLDESKMQITRNEVDLKSGAGRDGDVGWVSAELKVDLEDAMRAKKTAGNKKKKDNARANKLKNAAKVVEDIGVTAASIDSVLAQGSGDVEEDLLVDRAFEIKSLPGKGVGLFAVREFAKGEKISREAPLIPVFGNGSWIKRGAEFMVASEERKANFAAWLEIASADTLDATKQLS